MFLHGSTAGLGFLTKVSLGFWPKSKTDKRHHQFLFKKTTGFGVDMQKSVIRKQKTDRI